VTVPKLFINHVASYDWLIALEFGRVDDAQPSENWVGSGRGDVRRQVGPHAAHHVRRGARLWTIGSPGLIEPPQRAQRPL
jgi:hypothetical protein